MQKQLFKFAAFVCATLLTLGLTACSSDPETDTPNNGNNEPNPPATEYELKAETAEVGATIVTLNITTKGITKVHYFIDEGDQLTPSELLVSTQGQKLDIAADGTQPLTISGFQADKLYAVHLAGTKDDDNFFGEVVKVTFTTESFQGDVSFFDIEQRAFKMHVNFPEDVKERGNVLKWGICDALLYSMLGIHAEALNRHDSNGTYFSDSKTFTFDNNVENIYSDGDYEDGFALYEPIAPGQPTYIMLGEYEYVKDGELGYSYTDKDGDELYGDYTGGWHEAGWYHAMFDYYAYTGSEIFGGGPHDPKLQAVTMGSSPLAEEVFTDQQKYWNGYYRVFRLRTELPKKLDGSFEIDDSKLKPNGGTIKITPTKNIGFYLAGIFTDETWEQYLSALPDRNPETIQWGLTTSLAFQSFGVVQLGGNTDLNPNDIWLYPDTDTRYRLVLVGMGTELDEDGFPTGESQCYQEHFYRLPKPTMPAPTIKVTAIDAPEGETKSPYELWFNVRCTSGDAQIVMYACDVKHNWDQALINASYSDIISGANYFNSSEVALINSEAGMSFKFTSLRPDKTYGLGVMAWNEEGTPSTPRYVEATTQPEELPARSESTLFEELKGDWLISAEYRYVVHSNETGKDEVILETRETPVHIGDLEFDSSIVTDALYEKFAESFYSPMSPEQVDAQVELIESTLVSYNEKTRNYNRLSCQGYDLYPIPPYHNYSATAYISLETLLQAAANDTYIYIDPAGMLYDFGPKWYLEIDSNGNVTMPFNAAIFDPALGISNLYIVGVNSTNLTNLALLGNVEGQTGHFPVEISEDKNTITIKPLEYKGEKYYPHCVDISTGACSAFIQTDITLRRNTTAATKLATRKSLPQQNGSMNATYLAGERMAPASRGRSITPLNNLKQESYKEVSISVLSSEQIKSNLEQFQKSRR